MFANSILLFNITARRRNREKAKRVREQETAGNGRPVRQCRAVAAPEVEQICHRQHTVAGAAGEERHARLPGRQR